MKKIHYIIIIEIITLIISYMLTIVIGKKLNPNILKYSETESKRFANIIVNSSVEKIDNFDDLIVITKDNSNQIESIEFNTTKVNNLLKNITEDIQEKLIAVEEGRIEDIDISKSLKGKNFKHIRNGIVCEVPFGSISGNSILSNTGPVIPVKLSFVGKVSSEAKMKLKTYGINTIYIELDLIISVNERITLPKMTSDIKIVKKIPIVMKLIQGSIPEYYNYSIDDSDSYSLPIK